MASESFSSVEALTRQFYDWERRGRGWQVWDRPVTIEPPFRPFFDHFASTPGPVADDGRKPTLLSDLVGGFWKGRDAGSPPVAPSDDGEPSPVYMDDPTPLVEVQAVLPPDTKITKDAAGQFLMSLGHVSRPASFEILASSDSILVQLAAAPRDERQMREQLQAYFPEALLSERKGYLEAVWDQTGYKGTAVVEFGLSKEFMRPLRCFERFDPDPLAGMIGAMAALNPEDTALFQVLFAPVRHAWPESILRAVTDDAGEPFFVDDPGIVKLATEKISSPLFAAVIRVAAQSPKSARAWRIAEGLGKSLRQFADAASNELIPLSNDEYDDEQHRDDVVTRRSCRSGILMNRDELVSLVHLPSASARSAKLKREERKTKAAPALAFGNILRLGENHHAGKTVPVSMTAEQRSRHMHLIGASGSGKSTLLLNMIVQDIENGEGLCVLDPHGDLIDQVLARIPEKRIQDVVLLDPADEEYPVGFNILSAHSDLERNLVASDLVSVFRRLSTSFGDQMTTVLGNAILAILESSEGGTLSDLRRFLVEREFRERFLPTVQDSEIVYYWQKEFPLLTGKLQGPILTRLDTFLRPKVIRHMVSQKGDRLDFAAIMNGRKILLAKLSQGLMDLNRPLVRLSAYDFWTGVDATSHTHFFGRTGGGKTSAAKWLAGAMLRAGWGSLIAAVKPEDIPLWLRYSKEHGRSNSLVLFDGKNERFNFLEYLIRMNGMQGIGTVTDCLMKILEVAKRVNPTASQRGGEPFWDDAARQVLRRSIPPLYSATGTLKIPDIIRFITTAPTSVSEVTDRAWQERSFFYKVMNASCNRPIVPMARTALQETLDYWSEQFCAIPDRTRGNVIITISTVLDRFLHGRLREAFCTDTTVVPEMTFGGALILTAMPTTTWQEDGVIGQSLFKFLWQRSVVGRNRLAPELQERPVFNWCDEAQEVLLGGSTEGDFLSICRSSKCAVVYLSQTLPGYIAKIGGDSPRDAALGLLGKFATHVLMSNSCPETNEFASRTIGKVVRRRANFSSGTSESVNLGMNTGESENRGDSVNYGRSSSGQTFGQGSHSSSSGQSSGSGSSYGENRGRGKSQNISAGYSENLEYAIEPGDFARTLKTGGGRNGNEVTAIWFQSGRIFRSSGTNWLLARFRQ